MSGLDTRPLTPAAVVAVAVGRREAQVQHVHDALGRGQGDLAGGGTGAGVDESWAGP